MTTAFTNNGIRFKFVHNMPRDRFDTEPAAIVSDPLDEWRWNNRDMGKKHVPNDEQLGITYWPKGHTRWKRVREEFQALG